MSTGPKVLLLLDEAEATVILEGILQHHSRLSSARSLSEMQDRLQGNTYDVVLCGWSFDGSTSKDVLRQVQQQYPDLPVVVFCRTGGEVEWIKVLEAGAFDLLAAPYGEPGVLPVLEQAVRSYEARQLRLRRPCQRANAGRAAASLSFPRVPYLTSLSAAAVSDTARKIVA